MDENKICFIIASNNESELRECITYIKKLVIPDKYTIEMFIIREAPSLTKAYNTAIKSSKAKYKVYLHQDTFILYKNFIEDFIYIFNNSPKLGLLGVAGTKHLEKHSVWCKGSGKANFYSDFIDNSSKSSTKGMLYRKVNINFEGLYQKVEVIDGVIMITQYDIYWREDIFDGYHFYDISQSVEFLRAGYDVGVAKQKQTWCLHKTGKDYDEISYSKYRAKFIQEYVA